MLSLRHILYPIDFSERSLAAAPFVEAFARRFGAKVTILSAVQPLTYPGMSEPGAAYYVDPESLRADLEARLAGTLTDRFQGIPVARIADVGDPGHQIVAFAHANNVDLIMMTTHGRGVFRRLLLGSVTAKVLHDAHCPVWTSAHAKDLPGKGNPEPRKILCAVDLSANAGKLIQWAADLAKALGATLRLVHSVPGTAAWPERQLNSELEQALKEKARKEIEAILAGAGLDFPLCVDPGDVAGVVAEEARGHDADLVVIGRGVIQEKLGRLRTHAHSIIRSSPCPVISV